MLKCKQTDNIKKIYNFLTCFWLSNKIGENKIGNESVNKFIYLLFSKSECLT